VVAPHRKNVNLARAFATIDQENSWSSHASAMKTALPYIDYDLRYPPAAGSTLAVQQVAVRIWAIPSSASAGQHVRCSNIGDSVLSGPRGPMTKTVSYFIFADRVGPSYQAPSSTTPPKSAGLARFEGHPDGSALVIYAKRKSSERHD